MLRSLSMHLRGEPETQLPLTREEDLIKTEDVLNLSEWPAGNGVAWPPWQPPFPSWLQQPLLDHRIELLRFRRLSTGAFPSSVSFVLCVHWSCAFSFSHTHTLTLSCFRNGKKPFLE